MLALAKDAKKVYVSHVKPGGLSVVDAGSGELSRFVKLPDGAEGMAISPDGESVWVASHQASRISVISTATNDVTQSIICPGMPFRMKFAPSGKVAAISCPGAGAIAFIDLETPTKVEFVDTNLLQGKPIGLQNTPTSIAFSLDGTQVFAVGSGDQSGIVAVNAATRTLTRYAKSLGPIPDALTAGKIQWGVE
jgi:YVTN family beta-propeller protein